MPYRERLNVPAAWWVLSGLFALSLLLAFGFYLGPLWGTAVAAISFAATAALFAAAAVRIEVTETSLTVGRAHIDGGYLAGASALDAVEARRRRGTEADARAYLVLRPYISTAVLVTLADAGDPAPYWLLATRRPGALAAAVADISRGVAAAADPEPQGRRPESGQQSGSGSAG